MAPAAIGGLSSARAAGHRGSAAAEPPGSELAWKQVAPACRGLTCMPFGPRAEVPVPRPGSCCAPWGTPRALPRGRSKPRAGRRWSARAAAQRKCQCCRGKEHTEACHSSAGTPRGAPFVPRCPQSTAAPCSSSAGPGWPLRSAPVTFCMRTETENVAGPSGIPRPAVGSQPQAQPRHAVPSPCSM